MNNKRKEIGIAIGGVLICLVVFFTIFMNKKSNGNSSNNEMNAGINQNGAQYEAANVGNQTNEADVTAPTSIGQEIKDIILQHNNVLGEQSNIIQTETQSYKQNSSYSDEVINYNNGNEIPVEVKKVDNNETVANSETVTKVDETSNSDLQVTYEVKYVQKSPVTAATADSFCWVTTQLGYNAKVLDTAMTRQFRMLYKTEDGGTTWTEVKSTPSNYALQSYVFITKDLGFFCYKNNLFYRTENGGLSYDTINLPKIQLEQMGILYEPFSIPEAPWMENGILYMYYAQDENGDFKGGNCKALLKSVDQGKTWLFTGRVISFIENNG